MYKISSNNLDSAFYWKGWVSWCFRGWAIIQIWARSSLTLVHCELVLLFYTGGILFEHHVVHIQPVTLNTLCLYFLQQVA